MHKFITHKKENFTMIDNALIKDPSISAKSKAVIIYLLSKPKEWNASVKDISRHFTDGVDSIKTALKELERSFYLYRDKKRNKVGHFITTYNVYEDPKTNPKNRNWYMKSVQSGKSTTDQSGLSVMVKPQINNTDSNKIKNIYKKEFDLWYSLYDKKTTKKQALEYWTKNIKSMVLIDKIMLHTKRYVNVKEKVYRKDPIRYLRDEVYEDEIIKTPKSQIEREKELRNDAEKRMHLKIEKHKKYMEKAEQEACSDEERREELVIKRRR